MNGLVSGFQYLLSQLGAPLIIVIFTVCGIIGTIARMIDHDHKAWSYMMYICFVGAITMALKTIVQGVLSAAGA